MFTGQQRYLQAVKSMFSFSHIFATKAKPAKRETSVLQLLAAADQYTPARADARTLLKLYRKNPWVRSIVSRVAQAAARQAWYVEDKDGNREDVHPALDFIRSGWGVLRGKKALQAVVSAHMLSGEALLVAGRNRAGLPIGFAVLTSDQVEDIPNHNSPFFMVKTPLGGRKSFDPDDCIWIHDFDPADLYGRGVSVTGAAAEDIETDAQATKWLNSYFKNSARPDMIISGTKDDELSQGVKDAFEASWMQKLRGVVNRGRPLFTDKPIEVQEIGSGLRDNQAAEIKPLLKSTIAEIYGVPPEVLGRIENSNRATIDSADYLFARMLVDPVLSLIHGELQPFLDIEFGLAAEGLRLCYESPIAEDSEPFFKAAAIDKTAFTKNELRAAAKKRPVPDGDKPLEADKPVALPGKPGDPPAPTKLIEAPAVAALPAPAAKSLSPEDIIRVSDAHAAPEVVAEVSALLDGVFKQLLEKYGADVLEILEVDVRFQLNTAVANFLADYSPKLLGEINSTTRDKLRSALLEGATTDAEIAKLIDSVEQIFADAAEMRAVLIGQTEATNIAGFATLEASKQAGFLQKKWLSSQDHVVRDSHRALNGQVKNMNEPFTSPRGGRADHPGAFHEAAEDINCRCAVRPILPGEKSVQAGHLEVEAHAMREALAGEIADTLRLAFSVQRDAVVDALKLAFRR